MTSTLSVPKNVALTSGRARVPPEMRSWLSAGETTKKFAPFTLTDSPASAAGSVIEPWSWMSKGPNVTVVNTTGSSAGRTPSGRVLGCGTSRRALALGAPTSAVIDPVKSGCQAPNRAENVPVAWSVFWLYATVPTTRLPVLSCA